MERYDKRMDWNLEERENKAITQIFLNKCEVTWVNQLRCLKSVCIYTSYWRNCSCSQQEKGGKIDMQAKNYRAGNKHEAL